MQYTLTSQKKRLRILFATFACILLVISGRLVYVQLFTAQSLRLLAAEQWYRDLPLMAKRGGIYDANGMLMAQSTLTYSIYVRPVAVTNPERVATVLADHLGMSYDFLLAKAKNRGASEHLIKMQVEKDVALEIARHNEDGIFLSQTYRRDYPLGATGGQVLGLVSIDNHGQEGIEAYYNKYLRGVDGRSAVESDLRGKPLKNGSQYYVPSLDGHDLNLNIDANIQRMVQDVIQKAYIDQGAKNVSALVMDVATSGVVASASAPFYDLNNQPRDNVAELLAGIKNLPMINVLEPGSTFKIITLAAAIEEGLTKESDRFNCPGFRMIAGERVKCWRSKGHSTQTLAEGVAQSCNCVFMDLGLRLGVDKYYEYLAKFGIGKKVGIDTFAEPNGLILDKKFVREVDLARIAFGQAIAVSPIQFQTVLNAIVGDGIMRTPRIVNNVDGVPDAITTPNRGKILSDKTCERVRELMYGVVNVGSGKHAGHAGFNIGGKTGTAQKYKNGIIDQGKYISSFIGFLTVDGKAKYTAYLMVDEPSKQGYYGSIVAAPYVGQIFGEIIAYKGFKPDPNIKGPFIPEWLVAPNAPPPLVTLPDINGMELYKAIALLQTMGFYIDVDGDGDKALGTFPEKGSRLKIGEPVVVLS
ncbi:MAG: PASTA domain-containing protein [Christensenellaceae bacterium]|jgi:stage V sporulation protein D (sporulation-specific penicillin-binding protein)|nr:PASTA domain-containing protein [Christensenellaceae bacterium]